MGVIEPFNVGGNCQTRMCAAILGRGVFSPLTHFMVALQAIFNSLGSFMHKIACVVIVEKQQYVFENIAGLRGF